MLRCCNLKPSCTNYVTGILPLTVQSQVLPERFVYVPRRFMFLVMLFWWGHFIWIAHMPASITDNTELLGRRYECRDTKVASWGRGGSGCLVLLNGHNLGRTFFFSIKMLCLNRWRQLLENQSEGTSNNTVKENGQQV